MNSEFTIFEVLMLLLNIGIFFISKKIFNFLYQDDLEQAKKRISVSIFLASAFLILQITHISTIFFFSSLHINDYIEKIFLSLLTIYSMLIFQSVVHYIIKLRMGIVDEIDGKKIPMDTPSSRMWSLVTLVVIIFSTIYFNIQIWSAASLMETTGIVGITLGALALTNGVWFPDIYGGIASLNNKAFSVGDVIAFDNKEDFFIVNKANFFHLSLLNILDNNRTTIPNNMLNKLQIHNLSKISTQQGLRRTISYKIGYPKHLTNEEAGEILNEMKKQKKYKNIELSVEDVKEKHISDYIDKVRKIAKEAQESLLKNEQYKKIISEHEFRIQVLNTGDHAIEFVLSYYIKRLPKSFITEHIREYLIRTPLMVNEEMLLKSYRYGIDLSTPITYSKV